MGTVKGRVGWGSRSGGWSVRTWAFEREWGPGVMCVSPWRRGWCSLLKKWEPWFTDTRRFPLLWCGVRRASTIVSMNCGDREVHISEVPLRLSEKKKLLCSLWFSALLIL